MSAYLRNRTAKSIVSYVIMILIIFSSRDTWISYHNRIVMYISMAILFSVLGAMAIHKRMIDVRTIKIVVFLFTVIICSMIFNLDFSGYSMFIVLLIALLVEENFEFSDFYFRFENVIFFFAVISLVLSVIWLVVPNSDFWIFQFINIFPNEAVPWQFRLYGIFREPAMFCIYLGIGIARWLFVEDKKNYIKIVIYLIAILLTGSTTGYISVGFALVCFWLFEKHDFKSGILLTILFVAACIWAMNNGFIEYFLSKIATTGSNAASSNSRYYSIICGAIVGIKYPLFGAGAIKSEVAFNNILKLFSDEYYCWANMVTYLWASFGCIFVYLFLRGIYGALQNKKKIINLCWLIFVILLLCGETMTYSSVMYIFMLYGFRNIPLGAVRRVRNIRKEINIGDESCLGM